MAFELGSTSHHLAARPCPDGPVQDPERLAAAVREALAECAAACADGQVLAIAVSTAMHGLLALDAGKRPLTPLLTWADDRAAEQAWWLHTSGLGRAPDLAAAPTMFSPTWLVGEPVVV
ncbi:FGGY family carbohydrate kinase [Nonomuraea sp. NPDC050536]|uniref:FGGY family carbohydrate kinase n=1 Tax=Nonomuraea sp. NPDC050536 TaxID=3364366 RepID=UPI0037C52965